MPIGKLETFNINSQQWPAYIRRVKQYILLNEIKAELCVPLLITIVGDVMYSLMCDLCSPVHPESKTFDELVTLVSDHLEPQRSEIAERHVFRLRRQEVGESLTEYLHCLKHLASTCNFGTNLEENLRDQFVSGLANEMMRSQIFAGRNIKYGEAVELALALEAAERHAKLSDAIGNAISGAAAMGCGSAAADEGLHYARRERRGGGESGAGVRAGPSGVAAASRNAARPAERCWRCGKLHWADKCRFAQYNCDVCGVRGHLKVMCKKGRGSARQNYLSEKDCDTEVFGYIQDDGIADRTYFIELQIDRQFLKFEVDTGSRISTISLDFYRQNFSNKQLIQDNLQLRTYVGSTMESLGYIKVDLVLRKVSAAGCRLYVIRNGRRPLLGREWMRALQIHNVAIELNEIIDQTSDPLVSQLTTEFPEMCSDKIETFNKTTQLHTTDNKPETMRGRAVPLALCGRVKQELTGLEREGTNYRVKSSENRPAESLGGLSLPWERQEGDILSYTSLVQPPVDIKYIANETGKDRLLSKIKRYVMFGWPSKTVCDEEKPYFSHKDKIMLKLGCLVFKNRLVIPRALRRRILEEIHEGHLGINKMRHLSRSYVSWPSLDVNIENICRSCKACQAVRDVPLKAALLHSWELPLEPWQCIHVDFTEYRGIKYFILIDTNTKWIEAIEMKRNDAESIITVLRSIFARFGFPSQVVTDNKPPFLSPGFKEYCRINFIKHVTSAPNRHQDNGAATNAIKIVKNVIIQAIQKGKNVLKSVCKFLFQYRNGEHTTTGISPALALFGHQLRGRRDALRPDDAAVIRTAQRQAEVSVGYGLEWRPYRDKITTLKTTNRYSLSRQKLLLKNTDNLLKIDNGADETCEEGAEEESAENLIKQPLSRTLRRHTVSSPVPPKRVASPRMVRSYNRNKL